jgi:hypothetical protein
LDEREDYGDKRDLEGHVRLLHIGPGVATRNLGWRPPPMLLLAPGAGQRRILWDGQEWPTCSRLGCSYRRLRYAFCGEWRGVVDTFRTPC